MKIRLFGLLCAIAMVSGCKKTSVYFVPVGDAPISAINDLVPHYREKFDLKCKVLAPMALSTMDVNRTRQQLIAENVLLDLQRNYTQYLTENSVILIGITEDDMYPLEQNWQFCFGWRSSTVPMAIISTARMDIHYPGQPVTHTEIIDRLQKVVTKDIGIMFYKKPPSENPRSVLYNGILGIQELDQVSEDF